MVASPWAWDWYHAPEMRPPPNKSTGVQDCAPDAATYAVLYTYMVAGGLGFPTFSTAVGGVQSALRSMMEGFMTSQGTPKPWGMDEPEV